MSNNPFNKQDNLQPWFEGSKDYNEYKQQILLNYLQSRNLYRNNFMSIKQTYLNLVTLVTKNAIVATVIMILAVGGASTAAAQFFAPQEYKPSTLLNLTNKEAKKAEEVQVSNFAECQKAGGTILQTLTPPVGCEYNGQTYWSETLGQPNPPEDPYKGWETFKADKYGFEIKHPANFNQLNIDQEFGNGGRLVVFLQKEGTGSTSAFATGGDYGQSIVVYVEKNTSTLQVLAQQEFDAIKNRCLSDQTDKSKCSNTIQTTNLIVPGGTALSIDNLSPVMLTTENGQVEKTFQTIYAKSDYNGQIYKLSVQNDFTELDKIMGSLKFFDPANTTDNSTAPKNYTYTNPFYPDLEIKYDPTWEFSTYTEPTSNPNILKRTVQLNKNDVALIFNFEPIQVVDIGCAEQIKDIMENRKISDELYRYKEMSLPNRFTYSKLATPSYCSAYFLKMANMDSYLTIPNANFTGRLVIEAHYGNADSNSDTMKEADQIVLNSKFK